MCITLCDAAARVMAVTYAPPLTIFVLVPQKHGKQPLVVRADAAATIAAVKEKVQKSNAAFGKEKQRLLREHSNEALDDRATLASLGLDRDEFPTLKLELHSEPVAVPSVLQATIVSVMAPAVQAAEAVAATKLQAGARRIFARRELEWRKKAMRLLEICARSENRAAEVIEGHLRNWRVRANEQARQRQRKEREQEQLALATELAAEALDDEARRLAAARLVLRTWRRRRALRLAAQARRLESLARSPASEPVAAAAAQIAASSGLDLFSPARARAAALPVGSGERRPIGMVHLQTAIYKFNRYQLISWRRRYAFATEGALCLQRVRRSRWGTSRKPPPAVPSAADGGGGMADQYGRRSSKLMPVGTMSMIPFHAIRRVGVQADDPLVLVIQCFDNEYTVRFATVPHCEEWAAALCAAAAQAASAYA